MQILFLNPCAQLGGAERCLLDTLASLRKAKPDWRLQLIAGEDGPLLSQARALGMKAECLPFPPTLARLGAFKRSPFQLATTCLVSLFSLVSYRLRLSRAIARCAPDIIHSNGFKMHLLAAWTPHRAPVIWHLHDYITGRGITKRALQLSSSRCSGAVAISESVAADARQSFSASLPIKTILNGVDLWRFQPRGPQLDLGSVPSGTVRVGLIATFARWKGHEVFLRALAHPHVRGLNLHAYVIGGPIYQTENSQHSLEDLQALTHELGLQKRVTLTGFLEDSAAAMRALDIVVHASTAPEPFGLVIAEAMACGRATIASQAGGAAEVFDSGRTGIGTPPGDVAALADAIARLTRDGIQRLCMGHAASIEAQTRFNRDRLGPALAAFYKEVLQPCEFSTSTAEISTAA